MMRRGRALTLAAALLAITAVIPAVSLGSPARTVAPTDAQRAAILKAFGDPPAAASCLTVRLAASDRSYGRVRFRGIVRCRKWAFDGVNVFKRARDDRWKAPRRRRRWSATSTAARSRGFHVRSSATSASAHNSPLAASASARSSPLVIGLSPEARRVVPAHGHNHALQDADTASRRGPTPLRAGDPRRAGCARLARGARSGDARRSRGAGNRPGPAGARDARST